MSFNIALSGIQAINEQLNSISNNIANAGTYGYKAQRANFSSMYASGTPTGTQIGSVTQNIGLTGGLLNTGRSLDASIDGKGFFTSKAATGELVYSRVGIFTKDGAGYLVDSAGRRVQGAQLDPANPTAEGKPGDILIPTGKIAPKASKSIDFEASLSSDWKAPATAFPGVAADTEVSTENPPAGDSYNMQKVTVVYDTKGNAHTVTQYFVRPDNAGSTVSVFTTVDGALQPGDPYVLTFDTKGVLVPPTADSDLTTSTLGFQVPGADDMSVVIDYTGTTFYAGEPSTGVNIADGYAAGDFVDLQIGADGQVIAKYSNNQSQAVGQILLATFTNQDALTPVNDTSWTATAAVGTIGSSKPLSNGAGGLSVGTLEGSNVDITTELVGLMGSQRNYQANSKVITTENEMLQSLMQAL